MFCTSCGSQIPDGSKFCGNCGAVLEVKEPVSDYASEAQTVDTTSDYAPFEPTSGYQSTNSVPNDFVAPNYSSMPASDEALKMAGSALTSGILAMVFACTFFLSFLGIIFGIVGLKKVGKARAEGATGAKPIVAKCLSIAGIALGSFLTVYMGIMILTVIAEVISNY